MVVAIEGRSMTPERFPFGDQMMTARQVHVNFPELSIAQVRYRLNVGCNSVESIQNYNPQATRASAGRLGGKAKSARLLADLGSLDVDSAIAIARNARRKIIQAIGTGHSGILVAVDTAGNYRSAPRESVQASTMQGPRWNIVGTYNAAADVSQIADDIREAAEDFA